MARLIETWDGLPPEEGEAFLARLVLLLANEVGDLGGLLAAVTAASPPRP
ncbi:MAG: DUF2783 domain-containing protein [Actinobacteria bacterium]|nr:DUF2783 domain-containing protein [Actinomycetota bacterium]